MQKYSFGLTDLTSFDKPAGEYWLAPAGAARRGRRLARSIAKTLPEPMLAGLCIVAFDQAGKVAAVVPLTTVH